MSAEALAKLAESILTSHAAATRAALDTADRSMAGKLSLLEREWIAAQADDKARIPTGLSLAIVNLLGFRVRPEPQDSSLKHRDGDGDWSCAGAPLKRGG